MNDTAAALAKPASDLAGDRRATLVNRLRHIEPVALVWLGLVLLLLFLVVAPLAKLLAVSFEAQDTGDFTLANYATAYSRARYLDALRN